MSRSPDSETDATSSTGIIMANTSPSTIRGRISPVSFLSRTNSPVSEVNRKEIIYPTYPIIIPAVNRVVGPLNQSPESGHSRSPSLSCVSVITSGRRASSPAGLPSSSSPLYEQRARSRSPEPLTIHRMSLPLDMKSRLGRSPQESPSDRCSSSGASSSVTDSKQLKFGMERILSEETRPVRRHQHQDSMMMASNVPCSECVSSLLRCCRLSAPGCEPTPSFCSPYYTTLHTPRPVRPYTNMLTTEGVHMSASDRCGTSSNSGGTNKRKRSWSRAVFSNLQRKGLEKRFQLQKYITKPDRRQLAATLGLTDAQVKVWFQNRRMKWRHSKEAKHQQSGNTSSDSRSAREEQGGPDSTQEPEIDIQTLDS